MKPTEADLRRFWSAFETMAESFYMTPLHTTAAIQGNAPALSGVLALCCDYRVMTDSESFRFGLNETSLGMVPPAWLAAMTARTIGERRAELHLGGSSMLTPREALDVGYLDEVCEPDALMQTATAASLKACKIPFKARAGYKQHVRGPVAAMCGPESVDMMTKCILGDEFQTTVAGIMAAMKERKK